jgi:hypothetical protein
MMTEDYTIEQLEKTFKEHAEIYEQDCKENFERMLEQAITINGQIPIEKHFNISEALHVICREITLLKREINYGKTFQRFKSGDA